MTGRTLMLLASLLCMFMALRGLQAGGFGHAVRYYLASIVMWLALAAALLVANTDPHLRNMCIGCN
jgi:type IV secretory pathway TrbD component